MSHNRLDVTGQRYERLVAISREPTRPTGKSVWRFKCDCGNEKVIALGHVRGGRIRSCGCIAAEFQASRAEHCKAISKLPRRERLAPHNAHLGAGRKKSHGMTGTRVHAVWKAMIQRCTNPNAHDYRWYGALGVKVCEAWRQFSNFYADMGEPNGLTLDRIDPFGNYEPGNCKWETWERQRENKRKNHA